MNGQPESVVVGDGTSGPISLMLRQANRHGLVTGATGTGKTVTLQRIAEGFALAGVPVFAADVKGDLAGIAAAKGTGSAVAPAVVWDLFGRKGHSVRTTISEFGPFLFAELLQLNPTQAGVLEIVFRFADVNGLLLIDLKDLRSLLVHVSENAKTVSSTYGQVAPASIAAIQRGLLSLETQGAEQFFGEPALGIGDLMRTDPQGRGYVNILAADQLIQRPKLYASFLLWLLSELFETLPEVGDLPKPKLVFFFDEAHLLFDGAPKMLVDKVEQVVRLIRSKGVGVYFVTQNPLDVPDEILGQLGNRVQHALRAFTPRDQKAVRAAAETFRQNPTFDTAKVITELGVGEALVSMLDEKGAPGMVDRVKVRLPESRLGPLTDAERQQLMAVSPVAGRYDRAVDRESAYERLSKRVQATPAASAPAQSRSRIPESAPSRSEPRGRQRESVGEAMAKSVARSIGNQIGRQIVRGVLGAILKGR